jgi:hypothetical protein
MGARFMSAPFSISRGVLLVETPAATRPERSIPSGDQETLLAAWRGPAGFEGRASVRAWLYLPDRQAAIARPYGMIVVTLAEDAITALAGSATQVSSSTSAPSNAADLLT